MVVKRTILTVDRMVENKIRVVFFLLLGKRTRLGESNWVLRLIRTYPPHFPIQSQMSHFRNVAWTWLSWFNSIPKFVSPFRSGQGIHVRGQRHRNRPM